MDRVLLRSLPGFLGWLRVRLLEDRLLQVAGSLTFSSLVALVPVLTIALTVFSAFPVIAGFWNAIRGFILANLLPGAASKVMSVYVQQFAENAGQLTALGLVILSVAAVTMMLTIDGTFNRIWRTRRPRPLLQRLLTYWGVLTIGPLLVGASLSLTSWLVSQSMGLLGGVPGAAALALKLVPLVLTCLAFAFLYRTVPNRRVETADAMIGGLTAGLLFETIKALFGVYVRHIPTYKLVYGAFASFPIFLSWIYVSWLIVLLGAELTAALPYLRSGGIRLRRAPGTQLLDAVRLLRLLYQAHRDGKMLYTADLRAGMRMAWEECEAMLERLVAAGWVAPVPGERWVLARDLAEVTLSDVYREFVFNAAHDAHSGESDYEHAGAQLAEDVHDDLGMSLESLFRHGHGNATGLPAPGDPSPRRRHSQQPG